MEWMSGSLSDRTSVEPLMEFLTRFEGVGLGPTRLSVVSTSVRRAEMG
jgi:hypothetical protein